MPRGPRGQKRPANVIGNAVRVMRIATGEIEEDFGKTPKRAKGGRKGGKARACSLTAEQRSKLMEIGHKCPVHRTLKSEIVIQEASVLGG